LKEKWFKIILEKIMKIIAITIKTKEKGEIQNYEI
jgi:hypothetical protein